MAESLTLCPRAQMKTVGYEGAEEWPALPPSRHIFIGDSLHKHDLCVYYTDHGAHNSPGDNAARRRLSAHSALRHSGTSLVPKGEKVLLIWHFRNKSL